MKVLEEKSLQRQSRPRNGDLPLFLLLNIKSSLWPLTSSHFDGSSGPFKMAAAKTPAAMGRHCQGYKAPWSRQDLRPSQVPLQPSCHGSRLGLQTCALGGPGRPLYSLMLRRAYPPVWLLPAIGTDLDFRSVAGAACSIEPAGARDKPVPHPF